MKNNDNNKTTDLESKYYDTKSHSSFSGVNRLVKHSKKSKKDVVKWLSLQDTYTLHKPVRKHFKRRRVLTGSIGYQYQVDLVDVRKFSVWNNGMNFLLMCIDCFSKFGYAKPLKTKKSFHVIPALREIFCEGRKPMYISFDAGSEFVSNVMKKFYHDEGVFHFTFRNSQKAQIVERFNQTILHRLYRYFTYANTYRYIEVLPNIIDAYNRSFHRSIKTAPIMVTKNNQNQIWQTLYGDIVYENVEEPKFKVGDTVRLAKLLNTFAKGYSQQWTEELFTVSKVHHTFPPVYSVKDYKNEEIDGRFYAQELQKVGEKEEFIIEKVIGERKVGRRKELLVKWLGYDNSYNSYIPASSVRQFKTR